MKTSLASMLKRIQVEYFKPWDRIEKILIILTGVILLLDALTTLELRQFLGANRLFELFERNPTLRFLLTRNPLSIFPYFLSWFIVIILFRIIRSAEFTLAIYHITGNGIAFINNLGLILLKEPITVSLLKTYSLTVEQLIIFALLTYLFLGFLCISKIQDNQKRVKSIFLHILGFVLALFIEIDMALIWSTIIYLI